jgi:hypothetical protein
MSTADRRAYDDNVNDFAISNPAAAAAPAMAAPSAPAMAPYSMPPVATGDSFNPDFSTAPAAADEGALSSPIEAFAPASPEQHTEGQDVQTQQRVHEVLHSDVGVSTLLNRLKASIASARVSALPRTACAD